MLPRYLFYLLPCYYVGIAVSYRMVFSLFQSGKVVYVLTLLFLLVQIPYGLNYYTSFTKEDWRGFSALMQKTAKGQDYIVLVPSYMRGPFDYYYRNESGTVTESGAVTLAELEQTRSSAQNNSVYYVVTSDIFAVDTKGEMVEWLKKNTSALRQYTGINLFKEN